MIFAYFAAVFGGIALWFKGKAEGSPASASKPAAKDPVLGAGLSLSSFLPSIPNITLPTVTLGAAAPVSSSSAPAGGILSADAARALIAQGKWSQVKGQALSRWFKWGDAFANRTSAEIARGGSNLTIMRKIQAHAQRLDRVFDIVGSKPSISSWYREGTKTEHSNGGALDVGGSRAYHVKVLSALKRVGWDGGIGMSKPGYPARLHIDSNGKRLGWYYLSDGKPHGAIDWLKQEVTA